MARNSVRAVLTDPSKLESLAHRKRHRLDWGHPREHADSHDTGPVKRQQLTVIARGNGALIVAREYTVSAARMREIVADMRKRHPGARVRVR